MDRQTLIDRETVTRRTAQFYSSLPFNFHGSTEQAIETIKTQNQIQVYRDLDEILRKAGSRDQVLDVGCGSGWFVNSVAYHYGLTVTGIDLCEAALERGREVARELGVSKRTGFHSLDLFDVQALGNTFFVVNSLGVLHHTFDCREALRGISQVLQGGGSLHVGLYHQYGREPFLNLFKPYRQRLSLCSPAERTEVEGQAYHLYKELNPQITDEAFLYSWFRDQVLHPHESQHTLEEVYSWLVELGLEPLSTSINRFQPVDRWESIFEEEKKSFHLSVQRNCVEKRYFPGFFTVLSRKRLP